MPSSNSPHSSQSGPPETSADDSSLPAFIRTQKLAPGLYVVATPIGNLRDVTLRALDVLASADLVYAEDTRQTRRLFEAYGIKTPLRTYHDHNGALIRPKITEHIEEGLSIALVSDAGTPLISDPGFKLVRELREQDHLIAPIPGASALTAAISAAGLPSDTFTFAGFLPPKSAARKKRLAEFTNLATTLIVYETGNRIADTLSDLQTVFGDVEVVMAREITKLFETFKLCSVSELQDAVTEEKPKGEIVLLAGLTGAAKTADDAQSLEAFLLERIEELGAKGAANEAAKIYSMPKREIYALATSLKKAPK